MIDLVNYIVAVICAFILGIATHSILLHEKERHGWRFPWNHEEERDT